MSVFQHYTTKKTAEFTRLVGVNYAAFNIILQKLETEITRYKDAKPARKRGLKTSSLTLADQLLLTLLYLRNYHTFLQLGDMFGISEGYACKRYAFITQRLTRALALPNDKELTLDKLTLVADVTEQEIERPRTKQKSYYSGKKKRHTIKTLLIICYLTGLIKAVRSRRGTVHDFKILTESNLKINAGACIKADKGFQGLQKLYEKAGIPFKATKNHPLSKEQKQHNRQLAKERILIEHINRECKIFRICKEQYRGKHKNYEKTWKLVSAIVNLKRSTRHLKYATL